MSRGFFRQKDIGTLLIHVKNKKIQDGNENTKNRPSVVEWFEMLNRSLENNDPLIILSGNNLMLLVPHLLQLLRECLLSHQWKEAVKVLNGLSREHSDMATTVWKVGMELFYTNPDTNGGLIDQLVNQLKWCSDLNVKEVVMEYIIYLLDQGRLLDATQSFMNVPKLRGMKKERTQKMDYIDIVFEAYHGLVWYVEWLSAKNQMEHQQQEISGSVHLQGMPSSCNHEELMKKHYQKAVDCFECLNGKAGIWDIFITKHAELLEYYGELEQCQKLLEDYKDINSDNPNAYKYLYEFCVRNNLTIEKKKEILKALAKQVPSDHLVLDLCELLTKDEEVATLGYLFNLLDYSVWQVEERPWKLLSDILSNTITEKSSNMVNYLQELWDIRSSWWPAYHFTNNSIDISSTSCKDLMFYKAKCATVLIGPGNMFLSAVKEHLNSAQKQKLKQLELCGMILKPIT